VNILSIQSWVAYGHVGNASAVFPLQRLGAEVWAINTVQFSNHTGYGSWRGQVFPASLIRDCVGGIEERGALPRCDAVLSGYMGDAEIGEAIFDAADRVRAANAKAVWCCDPVIGDVGPRRVRAPRHPRSSSATGALPPPTSPRRTSSSWNGSPAGPVRPRGGQGGGGALAGERAALRARHLAPRRGHAGRRRGAAGRRGGGFWRLRTPMLRLSVNGAGDAIAALFLFHRCAPAARPRPSPPPRPPFTACCATRRRRGSREILTVAAQEEFVAPSEVFRAEPLLDRSRFQAGAASARPRRNSKCGPAGEHRAAGEDAARGQHRRPKGHAAADRARDGVAADAARGSAPP
jgi:pyridoxine kinase